MKHDEEEQPAMAMTKRLSKALRQKRRWIGLAVAAHLDHRSGAEEVLETIARQIDAEGPVRLMDFLPQSERDDSKEATELVAAHAHAGLAIVRVDLRDAQRFRAILAREGAMNDHGFTTLTTSGKIRLVRERLGLPKPPKRNR